MHCICKVYFLETPNMDTTGTSLILLSVLATARSEIIKPWREWLCNYCSMGELEVSTEEQCRGGDHALICVVHCAVQGLQRTMPSAGLRYCVSSTGFYYSSYCSQSTRPSKEQENNEWLSLHCRYDYSGENRSSLLCLIDIRLRIIK